LRSSIGASIQSEVTALTFDEETFDNSKFTKENNRIYQTEEQGNHWTDRKFYRETGGYNNHGRGRSGYNSSGRQSEPKFQERDNFMGTRYPHQLKQSNGNKRCYICKRKGCWSTKHSKKDQYNAYKEFEHNLTNTYNRSTSREEFQHLLIDSEGVEEIEDVVETSEALADLNINEEYDNYLAEMGEINGIETVAILNDQSAFHAITKEDIFITQEAQTPTSSVFTSDRYSSAVYHGIIPDTGAAGVSTAGKPQVEALIKISPELKINTETAGQHNIRFGKGMASTIGTICVKTLLGPITFHVVPANTPFLYCIQDMDKMGVKLDNLKNVLIQGRKVVPVV
ncbi:hypothetical protein K3495_g13752, partial [Podosphaera aphanis]